MKQKLDDILDIRLACDDDIPNIMDFIDKHWKKNHILSQDLSFFYYEHKTQNKVNFLLAINKQTKEIEGMLGFLYSSKNYNKSAVWCTIWKVKDNYNKIPFLGLELKKRVRLMGICSIGVGSNPKTAIPLEKLLLKYDTKKMKHFYLLSKKENYQIAQVNQYRQGLSEKQKCKQIKFFDNIEEVNKLFDFEKVTSIPYKDDWYINHRYFQHPIYDYQVCGILDENNVCEALIVFREQQYLDSKILRIIDYIGNHSWFAGLSDFFQNQLTKYEYIDFYCAGFQEEYILKGGFVEKDENDLNIIPDYFNPFTLKNIDIWVSSSDKNCTFFKGDGDQDRPN